MKDNEQSAFFLIFTENKSGSAPIFIFLCIVSQFFIKS